MILIGWLSSILLAICGIPQAIKAIVDKHADGVSWLFVFAWFLGEIFGLIYVISLESWPLIFNYGINILSTLIILYFKIFEKSRKSFKNIDLKKKVDKI